MQKKAEVEHQDYYKKTPISYKISELGSGRYIFLDKTWGNDREVIIPAKIGSNKDFNKKENVEELRTLGNLSTSKLVF
ncbi:MULTISPECIES: hypothetical protein [unclassified Paenibacillus]|uniref:hypothetical protein n=1 Tax=unclassified Paenibacillus TaxID=185978 RepID=UPI0027881021|nr:MULTISPECIES: hypothetical protein [unclassified Paenibacillus]MDQ0899062.1 hypothetical protein [Paenibacillus sp. V4I7]MDQ0914953.1 hypothetical protein [Paenibacillus sp. V4I5]